MNWYLMALKKYAVFSGRSQRSEYWFFTLFYLIFALVTGFIDGLIGTYDAQSGLGVLSAVYMLAMIIPSLAVLARRLHDTGRSAWWILIGIIPLIGGIVLLVFAVMDSDMNDNMYGPNPKAAPASA